MRITFLNLLILTTGAAFVFGQDSTEPKELSSLRESFKKACSDALAPIEKKYSDALELMKERLTKAGNLEGALAVDAELKAILTTSTSQQKPLGESPDSGSSRAKLKALLPTIRIEGTWSYGDFKVVFAESEATLQPGTKFARTGPYEVIGPRLVRFTLPSRNELPNDREMIFEIEFTKDMTEFTTNRADLKGKVLKVTPQ